ncbi:GNAT family N-acetyltransferase [Massilia sp. G4R7]|uniref:GNAT family N-acetyltransferase n=1 Tax=Massilia phyllostachyos TaxID=2898585 RepID=A0ABS8QDC1_9BURK|nr:GNAT family N-acetyltransferase [Massilia phyllostachyos]MCD2519543.1 GNAT family N-acetyltransferase [Massilia phyllostachyos]
MSTRFEIRQATPADASAACALLRRSIEVGCKADHAGKPAVLEAWLGNKTAANVATWFSSSSNYAIVAQSPDGTLLGLCLLTQAGKVALCYVLPEALRGGVGRALLDACEQQARAWSIKKLQLHSPPSASAFFERQGFMNAGKDTSCFGMESDLLWKSLDASCEVGASSPGGAARKRFCNCNG